MSINSTMEMFEIKCLLKNLNIKLCAHAQSGIKQLIAVITSDCDVLLHYTFGELPPVMKRIPWFSDSNKVIEAICFDPTASWLLAICFDGSLYIIPALSLVDRKQRVDCKWSLTDVTHFPKHFQTPDARPTHILWWQTLDCNQNTLVGYDSGAISAISLTDGRCLGCCNITEPIAQMLLPQDGNVEHVLILINGESGKQWRLLLEHRTKGYLWPPDLNSHTDDSNRSRLNSLKQMGADKLASIKQKLTEGRGSRRDSQSSDSASESSHSETKHSGGPDALPHLPGNFVTPHNLGDRYVFSSFYKPCGILTFNPDNSGPCHLSEHLLLPNISFFIITNRLIFTVNDDRNIVSIVSCKLTECDVLEGDGIFNVEAVLALFNLEDEKVLNLYRVADFSSTRLRKKREGSKSIYDLPKSVEDLPIQKPKIDTCVIVTNCAVYRVVLMCSPIHKFVHLVTEENNIPKAERVARTFGLNKQELLEFCGDILLSKGMFYSGLLIYEQARATLLKMVLKMAITADCKTLVAFVQVCLSTSKDEMSMSTKIHMGNMAVMAYTELISRYGGDERVENTKEFMNFLQNELYDQELAVNVACQAGHWNIVTLLANCLGLHPEVVSALGKVLQTSKAPKPTDREFLLILSEPNLTHSLLVLTHSSQIVFKYIRAHVVVFPVDVLQRLAVQLDPSQPSAIPLVSRLFHTNKYSSSLDTTIESVDMENPDKDVVTAKDLIETFLYVIIHLSQKTDKPSYQSSLLDKVELPEAPPEAPPIKQLPSLKWLSCGEEHAAIIRNNIVYTTGVACSGCLGTGPLMTESSPMKPVDSLSSLRVKVLSVSCGRKHTLALTDYGIFSWGSNSLGQLGLGRLPQGTSHPQMITTLAAHKIIEITAGQYHSLALTSTGKVFTWGWGIHGQLGHGCSDNEFYPRLLKFEHTLKQVAAGHAHSLVLTIDGKIYGFGSNLFGQLETCKIDDGHRTLSPVWVVLMPDMYKPVQKIAAGYFHNMAIRSDQEVYTWGTNPQDAKVSKDHGKRNGGVKSSDPWKSSIHVFSGSKEKPVEQVAVGYKHSAVLHQGKVYIGKSKDSGPEAPKFVEQDANIFKQRILHLACGLDYTMTMDNIGKILTWGSRTIAKAILDKPIEEGDRKMDGKLVVFKNTKRVVRVANMQVKPIVFPLEVTGLPSMAITFNPVDHKLILAKNFIPYAIRYVENSNVNPVPKNSPLKNNFSSNFIESSPDLKFGQKTLHYVLQTYFGFYDTENVLLKCLDCQNYQAASKISILDGHFGDSLGFQLVALKKYMESLNFNLHSGFLEKDCYEIKEKDQGFVEFAVKKMPDDLNERNFLHSNSGDKISCNSPARILSSSSSLDSIRQWGDDIEHQGGCESPCEVPEMGDIRQNINYYVQSLKNNDNSPPISSVSKIVAENENPIKSEDIDVEIQIKDKTVKEIIDAASNVVEFYIKKIYLSENHILMQNVLMKCIEFWLSSNLPVAILENILLKNMDKYFYPLSILLFCKNFRNTETIKDDCDMKYTSAEFLKEFSTKFCLQLCSMVLENANKS